VPLLSTCTHLTVKPGSSTSGLIYTILIQLFRLAISADINIIGFNMRIKKIEFLDGFGIIRVKKK